MKSQLNFTLAYGNMSAYRICSKALIGSRSSVPLSKLSAFPKKDVLFFGIFDVIKM
jgi:hypothetical protein